MATTNHAGFTLRGGAASSTDLAQALAAQLSRFFGRIAPARTAAAARDSFTGPSFEQLSPGLVNETGRR